jgi:alkylation response protein AidB-like acyl-CoA dehydrogenase
MSTQTPTAAEGSLADAARILSAGEAVLEAALTSARQSMAGGKAIDDHQVQAERLAYAATELRAAR